MNGLIESILRLNKKLPAVLLLGRLRCHYEWVYLGPGKEAYRRYPEDYILTGPLRHIKALQVQVLP